MPDTLGSMAAEVTDWLRGDLLDQAGQRMIRTAIADAVDSIWMSMMQVQLARFYGLDSPVSFTLASGVERVKLVTIADPTVAQAAIQNVAGGALLLRTYLAGYTYVTESGSETLISPTVATTVPLNSVASVPPPAYVAGAFGWNCYLSPDNLVGDMALQNQQPLPFGVNFIEPVAGFQPYPANQQTVPVANTTADNISYIQHMEIRTSDTLLRAWNQHGLDSETMRRMGRTSASASEYGSYVWELTNGAVLEIRPMTGLAFAPRYWYVAKPRRARYDQAELPYSSITGVHEFVRNHTLGNLKSSVDEYLAAEKFDTKADKNRQEILLALNQENWGRDARITPYLF